MYGKCEIGIIREILSRSRYGNKRVGLWDVDGLVANSLE